MKKILISLILLCGCNNEKICYYELPNECHTKEEWDKISQQNFKNVKCLTKYIDEGDSFERALKRCHMFIRSSIEFAK